MKRFSVTHFFQGWLKFSTLLSLFHSLFIFLFYHCLSLPLSVSMADVWTPWRPKRSVCVKDAHSLSSRTHKVEAWQEVGSRQVRMHMEANMTSDVTEWPTRCTQTQAWFAHTKTNSHTEIGRSSRKFFNVFNANWDTNHFLRRRNYNFKRRHVLRK